MAPVSAAAKRLAKKQAEDAAATAAKVADAIADEAAASMIGASKRVHPWLEWGVRVAFCEIMFWNHVFRSFALA